MKNCPVWIIMRLAVMKPEFDGIDYHSLLADVFLQRGCPQFVRSDNGPEFIARRLIEWMRSIEVQPLFIEPGSPWENGYIESFNGKMRCGLLNGEIFYSLL